MKKKIRFAIYALILLTIITFPYVYGKLNGSDTIEKAIVESIENSDEAQHGDNKIIILHKIIEDNGAIVFYTDREGKHFSGAYIHKNILGKWELIYGGTHYYAKDDSINKGGMLDEFYQPIKDTPLPMFAGIITNDNIEKVKIIDKKSNEQYDTEIIETEYFTIWLNYKENFRKGEYSIQGLNKDGRVVVELLGLAGDSQMEIY